MTYTESANLMQDPVFRGRIKVAALQIAQYYLTEDSATQAHNSRYKWAQNTFNSPDAIAGQLQPAVVIDAQVQTDGPDISDDALKSVVEGVIGKVI